MYEQHHQSRLDKIAFAAGREAGEKDYWLNQLAGTLEKSSFPYEDAPVGAYTPGKTAGPSSRQLKFKMTVTVFEGLKKLSTGSNYRLHMILTAGIIALLNKYTGREDIIVGTSIYKQEIEAEFINTVLPLRIRLDGNTTFKELLLQVREVIAAADENQNYPMEKILQKLKIPYGIADPFPLFDVAVLLENIQEKKYIRHLNIDMLFSFLNGGEAIDAVIQYNASRYTKETVEGLAAHFRQLLRGVLTGLESALSSISILTPGEKQRFLVEMNDTRAPYPGDKTMHGLFEKQAAVKPDGIALACNGRHLSFRVLNEKAGALARVLISKGIKADDIAAVLMERSLDLIVGILGILKAGAAFLPIDPGYPEERVNYMLEDSGAKILLTPDELSNDSSPLTPHPSPFTTLAYIIYTSGTGGKPKGVMIDHRSIINYTWWAAQVYGKRKQPGVDFPLFTSIAFDLTMTTLFVPLATGHTVVVYGEGESEAVRLLERIMGENRVGAVKLTPSHLALLRHGDVHIPHPNTVRCLVVGGEELKRDLALDIYKKFAGNIEIYNEYGPTEATVGCMIYRFNPHEDEGNSVPIGGPIANTRVYILDRYLNPVPLGVVGELCIGGDSVARGYLDRPGLTAEKFRIVVISPLSLVNNGPNEQCPVTNDRLYHSGDLARWLPGRDIEFLGRMDHQVKIRGFRVEMGEVECRLLNLRGIKEAVVLAREEKKGNKYLCAYIVSDREYRTQELREHLSMELPGYMIPSYFVKLDVIPLNPNGKIDREALPDPRLEVEEDYIAPKNEVEEKLVEIWSEVLLLEKDKIGINSDFFHLGGHSLKAILLISLVHKVFDVKLALDVVFKNPSIRGLSTVINKMAQNRFISIEPVEEREYYPLSSAQKRLYVIHIMAKESTGYNVSTIVMLEGELQYEKFHSTFQRLIKRHESFRTSFIAVEDLAVQKVHKIVSFESEYFDLSRMEQGREHKEKEIVKNFIRGFDLSQAPLLRVGLIKKDREKYILMVDMHHIIADGVSLGVLVQDFMALSGNEVLDHLRVQYKDFSGWQNRLLEDGEINSQEEYWLNRFKDDIPAINLPYDFPGASGLNSDGGAIINFLIEGELTGKLYQLAKETGTSLYMVLLAVLNILLFKYTGGEDIVVGSPTAGRRHNDMQRIIGFFINILAMRNHPQPAKSFMDFLGEVKKNVLDAFDNQDYQFERLVQELDLQGNTGGNPLTGVILAVLNMEIPVMKIPGLTMKPYRFERKKSKFDLRFAAIEDKDKIMMSITYSTALFKQETVEKMGEQFMEILRQILDNRNITLKDIAISHGLLVTGSSSIEDYREKFEF